MNEAEALRREIDFLENQISAKRNMLIRLNGGEVKPEPVPPHIEKRLKADSACDAIKEGLLIPRASLEKLAEDVSEWVITNNEQDMIQSCIRIALALKDAKSINLQY